MNEERVQAIEQAIAAQVENWTNQSIYDVVGGNYALLSQYLKARRASTRRPGRGAATAVAEAEIEAQEAASLQEQLEAARQAVRQMAGTVQGLTSKAQTDLLSDAETEELSRLERRIALTEPVIARLAKEVAQQQEVVDVEAFRARWLPLVEAKREAYAELVESQRAMWLALLTLEERHREPEQAIDDLPPRLAGRLHDIFLPDFNTLKKRLVVNMPNAQAWDLLLCAGGQPRVATPEAIMQNDPGTKALPARLLPNFMEGKL